MIIENLFEKCSASVIIDLMSDHYRLDLSGLSFHGVGSRVPVSLELKRDNSKTRVVLNFENQSDEYTVRESSTGENFTELNLENETDRLSIYGDSPTLEEFLIRYWLLTGNLEVDDIINAKNTEVPIKDATYSYPVIHDGLVTLAKIINIPNTTLYLLVQIRETNSLWSPGRGVMGLEIYELGNDELLKLINTSVAQASAFYRKDTDLSNLDNIDMLPSASLKDFQFAKELDDFIAMKLR